MTRDLFIKNLLSDKITMNPTGTIADELSQEEFKEVYSILFQHILDIANTDISELSGYGE